MIVIAGGALRYDGPLKDLAERYGGGRKVVVRTRDEAPETLGPFVREDGALVARLPSAEVAAAVDFALRQVAVADLSIEEPPLEDVLSKLFAERT